MTWATMTPKSLATQSLAGLAVAHSDRIEPVDRGAVVTDRAPGHLAAVVGGESCHYPVFSGLVCPGLARDTRAHVSSCGERSVLSNNAHTVTAGKRVMGTERATKLVGQWPSRENDTSSASAAEVPIISNDEESN